MTTHYRQLTRALRYQIEAGLAFGMTQVRIAKHRGTTGLFILQRSVGGVRRNGAQQVYKAVLAGQGYTEGGHLPIDNNAAERAIQPFVIGRNYPQSEIMSGMQQW